MPAFRFRLATLLKLRETTRDERRSQLAEALRIETLIDDQLEQVEQTLARLLVDRAKSSSPGPVNVDWLLDAQRYELALRTKERDFRQQLQSVRLEVERRRQTLAEADREVRVLEKLRESQHERHIADERRDDQKVMDEIASLRHVPEESSR